MSRQLTVEAAAMPRVARRARGVHLCPVWHAGPGESTSTSSVSASQSTSTRRTCCMLPLVAPLFQSSWRLRLQNQVVPVFRVRASDSSLIHATMSTSPVPACCTTAGTRPRSSKRTLAAEGVTGSSASPA